MVRELFFHGSLSRFGVHAALAEIRRDPSGTVFACPLPGDVASELLVIHVPQFPETIHDRLDGLLSEFPTSEAIPDLAFRTSAISEQIQSPAHRERPLAGDPGFLEFPIGKRSPLVETALRRHPGVYLRPELALDKDPGTPLALPYAGYPGHALPEPVSLATPERKRLERATGWLAVGAPRDALRGYRHIIGG